jgi:Dockerin type I domain
MNNKLVQMVVLILLLIFTMQISQLFARDLSPVKSQYVLESGSLTPYQQIRVHKVGLVHMTITNYGIFGSQIDNGLIDPETGQRASSCEFPYGSDNEYLFHGALWIGAVVDDDTLVSVGVDGWQWVHEMFPEGFQFGDIVKRSTIPTSSHYHPDAVSEADYIATYYDTLTDQSFVSPTPFDDRPHIPLGLEIRQESYSWSDSQYEDFIIFRYTVKNSFGDDLDDVYLGLYFDADIFNFEVTPSGFSDDVSGYFESTNGKASQNISIAWSADNDGDPSYGSWDYKSVRGVFGVSMLDIYHLQNTAFNWWVSEQYNPALYDWGPMMEDNYRDFQTGGRGTPEGDCNKYYIMANGEYDYDQTFCKINHTNEGWLPTPSPAHAGEVADGYDTRFLLSFGEANLPAGDSITFAFVTSMGDDFHQNPDDFANLFDVNNPEPFYSSLDFSDLLNNVISARNLYNSLFQINYICGDLNYDGTVGLADIVYVVNYIFIGGSEPYPYISGDVNCDTKVNIIDVVFLVNYLFRGGSDPGDINNDGIPDC